MGELEIDFSAVAEMSESIGWYEFEKFINANLEDLTGLLIASSANDERNRGRIDAFRTMLTWPTVVAEEAKYLSLTKTIELPDD